MAEKEYHHDLFGEQRALARGQALVELDSDRVLALSGADRVNILQALSTQDFKAAGAASREALFLDSQGRVNNRAGVLLADDLVWLFADSAQLAQQLADYLLQMRFTLDYQIIHPKGHLYAAAAEGISAPVVWEDPWPQVQPGGYAYSRPAGDEGGEPESAGRDEPWQLRLLFSEEPVAAPPAGVHALRALRIAAGRPGMEEVDGRTLPHEVDWLRTAVHLNKGCYRGQETVAKLHNLGRPPRRLVRLLLDGQCPPPGAQILTADGKVIGQVSSSARHWELGPIALGLIKRAVPEGQTLLVEDQGVMVAAAPETLVSPDSGSAANIPRLPKLAAKPLL